MARHYQILLPLFSLFLVRVDLTDLWPVELEVEILKVYDGDTVLIQSGRFRSKLRFSRIDAPEKGQPFANGMGDAGDFSRQCLLKILPKTKATLVVEGVDMYGRLLGNLDQISYKLLKSGCTCLYPYAKFRSQRQKYRYLRAFNRAKSLRVGLWAHSGVEQPKNYRRKSRFKFRKQISHRQ